MISRASFVDFLYAVTIGGAFSKIGTTKPSLDFVILCVLILVVLEDYYLYHTQVLPSESGCKNYKFLSLVMESSILLAWYLSCAFIGTDQPMYSLFAIGAYSLLKITAGFFHWVSHTDHVNWRLWRYGLFLMLPFVVCYCWYSNQPLAYCFLYSFIAWIMQTLTWWAVTNIAVDRESLRQVPQ